MAQSMTPSKTMTAGQFDKTVHTYRALLEKHASDFPADAVQTVLGQSELASEMFAIFRKRVEALSNLIVRCAKVNRARKPQEVLDATDRKQYTDPEVVDSMPRGEGAEVEVVFFNLDRFVSDADLDKEYELRGLKPTDPYSLAAVNEADPAFADEKPNGTHWKDAAGKRCFVTFSRWNGERGVIVGRGAHSWNDHCLFSGLRKPA